MELEDQHLCVIEASPDADAVTDTVVHGDDGSKTPRLPRWTRHEIIVLIQAKKVAEKRVHRSRTIGSIPNEPKWTLISTFCNRNGVNRGPAQCRKRWGNLAADYRKIKEWESHIAEESDSFWFMRSDLRREKKLPGFFDREVFDLLERLGGVSVDSSSLDFGLNSEDCLNGFCDGAKRIADCDCLFSEFDEDDGVGSPDDDSIKYVTPIKAFPVGDSATVPNSVASEKQPASICGETSSPQKCRKRKSFPPVQPCETTSRFKTQLLEVLERNGKMIADQLEAHNNNLKLEQEQRKTQNDSLISVLDKLSDAIGKIADKL